MYVVPEEFDNFSDYQTPDGLRVGITLPASRGYGFAFVVPDDIVEFRRAELEQRFEITDGFETQAAARDALYNFAEAQRFDRLGRNKDRTRKYDSVLTGLLHGEAGFTPIVNDAQSVFQAEPPKKPDHPALQPIELIVQDLPEPKYENTVARIQ